MQQVFPKPRTNSLVLTRSSDSLSAPARIPVPIPAPVPAPSPAPTFDAPRLVRLWHLTSLDAPTVAAVWTLGFAWAADVRLPRWVPLLLALTAWAVYIADRLLDARSALRTAPDLLRERHFFHWRFRHVFLPLGVASACAAAWLILTRMPPWIRERDFLLGAAAILYFVCVHFGQIRRRLAPLLSKELMVGVLFTVACALPACYRDAPPANRAIGGPVVLFALVAWLNCHLIETWETGQQETDPAIHPRADACRHGGAWLALAVAAAAGSLAAVLAIAQQPASAALASCGAVSALLLAVLDRLRGRLTPVALRAAADLVLLTPVILLLALPTR